MHSSCVSNCCYCYVFLTRSTTLWISESAVNYQLRKSWLTKYKERDAYDGHICCLESTELRTRSLRRWRSLSRVHPRGVGEQLQTRRVGDTRPCIRHNMIEQLIKRWIAEDKRTRVAKLVDRTGFTERRLYRPPSLEAAARLLPSDARCRVQLCSATFGRRRLHSAKAAPKSCCTTPMIHPRPPTVLFTIRVMYSLSPRRGEEALALDISRNPGVPPALLWRLWKIFRPRDRAEPGGRKMLQVGLYGTFVAALSELWRSSALFFLLFFFPERQTKRTVLLAVPFDKADKLLRFTANLPAGFSCDYQTLCSAYQWM